MKIILNLDTNKEASKVVVKSPPRDLCGLTYIVQTIGYEQILQKYYLERSEWDSIMITYVLNGSGNFYYEGNFYNLEKGSLIIINCMNKHIMYPKKDQPFEIVFLHVNSPDIISFCSYINTINGPVINIEVDKLNVYSTINEILLSNLNKTYYQGKYQNEIYQMLIRIKTYVEENKPNYSNEPSYIQQTIKYIVQNYNRKISLEEIASNVSITPNHLETSFTKYTKFTIGEYISNVRLQMAQRELLISNKSISEIASLVGLSSSQALIRLFKRKIGITPLHYRINKNNDYR